MICAFLKLSPNFWLDDPRLETMNRFYRRFREFPCTLVMLAVLHSGFYFRGVGQCEP